MSTTTIRYVCPTCGSDEIGVWQVRHQLREVIDWTADGTPASVHRSVLNEVEAGYASPWETSGRYQCDLGHDFNEPRKEVER